MAVIVYVQTNKIVADLPGVSAAVAAEASRIAGRARAELSGHRDLGHTTIDVKHSRHDSYVGLNDRGKGAAMSIETDHVHNITGRPVAGLNILRHAAGLL